MRNATWIWEQGEVLYNFDWKVSCQKIANSAIGGEIIGRTVPKIKRQGKESNRKNSIIQDRSETAFLKVQSWRSEKQERTTR